MRRAPERLQTVDGTGATRSDSIWQLTLRLVRTYNSVPELKDRNGPGTPGPVEFLQMEVLCSGIQSLLTTNPLLLHLGRKVWNRDQMCRKPAVVFGRLTRDATKLAISASPRGHSTMSNVEL